MSNATTGIARSGYPIAEKLVTRMKREVCGKLVNLSPFSRVANRLGHRRRASGVASDNVSHRQGNRYVEAGRKDLAIEEYRRALGNSPHHFALLRTRSNGASDFSLNSAADGKTEIGPQRGRSDQDHAQAPRP